MKLVRRQTRRYKEIEKLRDSKLKKGAALGATMAISQIAMLSAQVGTSKTVHAASAQQTFINDIAPFAQELAGNNDLYASVMIAQAILESSWGTSALSAVPNHNLFGIKGTYHGDSTTMLTLEDDGSGKYYSIHASFRKYPSYYESLQDYVNLLKTRNIGGTTFYRGAWKSQTTSYKDATQWLTGRYATDTAYARKLNQIIERYHLVQYDSPDTVAKSEETATNTTPSLSNLAVNGQYVVQAGDTLWRVATKVNMSVENLKQLNGLTNDNIYVGQVLKLSTPVSEVNLSVESNRSEQIVKPSTVTPVETVTVETASTPVETVAPSSNVQSVETYTVKAGDTLWRISNRHGLSVNELKQLNGLSSDFILVGQILTVKTGGTSESVQPTNLPTVTPEVSSASVETTSTPLETVAPSQSIQSVETYTVKAGDTLWRISNRHGLSVNELKQLNGLSSDLILVGQILTVKTGGTGESVQPTNLPTVTPEVSSASVETASTPVETVAPSQSIQSVETYTVQAGDTLWRISNRHGLSVNELKQLNGLSSDLILVGQQLHVKQTKSTTASRATQVHVVQAGETLWRISNRYGLSVGELKQQNGLNSDLILVGQQLTI